MKTKDFVRALAEDDRVLPSPAQTLSVTLTLAVLGAAAGFVMLLGLRPDLQLALGSWRFDFKLLWVWLLAGVTVATLLRLARPGASSKAGLKILALLIMMLVVAVIMELFALPAAQWREAAVGHNSTWCLRIIPALAALPFLAGFWVLRQAAPDQPGLAGAINGLMAGACGASLYVLHCQDDSPLFVAIWYVLALACMTLLGALLGRRLLRW